MAAGKEEVAAGSPSSQLALATGALLGLLGLLAIGGVLVRRSIHNNKDGTRHRLVLHPAAEAASSEMNEEDVEAAEEKELREYVISRGYYIDAHGQRRVRK